MKIHEEEIQQLIFFKKLANNNRLDELILEEQEPYPPPQYTVNQIYSSQYATALHTIKQQGLIHQTVQNNQKSKDHNQTKPRSQIVRQKKSHPTHHLLTKYPLPLAFAYFHLYQQQKQYDKAISVIKNHLQRKSTINTHIVNYNLSFMYRQAEDCKKAIFYLQSTLKEKPFFEQALFDYAFLLSMNNRQLQAIQILKRHLTPQPNSTCLPPLSNSSYVQSMFLKLQSKTKSLSQKQVTKIFNNKSMKVETFFNLGLYFKKIKSLQKAENIFKQIIQTLDEGFMSKKMTNISYCLKQKDQKVYFYSKLNLAEIYEFMARQQQTQCNNSQNIRVYKHKAYEILNSLISNQIQAINRYKYFYLRHSEVIRQKLKELNADICSENNTYFFNYQQNGLTKSNRNLTKSKRDIDSSELKILNLSKDKQNVGNIQEITQKSTNRMLYCKNNKVSEAEKHQLELMKQFNRKFQERRMENQKKLKFLLLKDKELDNFFNTLPKVNQQKHEKSIVARQIDHSTIFNNSGHSMLTKNLNIPNDSYKLNAIIAPKNATLIKKLRKQLQEDNILCRYEEEFQRKKIKYEQQFEGFNLDEALEKIMNKIFGQQTPQTNWQSRYKQNPPINQSDKRQESIKKSSNLAKQFLVQTEQRRPKKEQQPSIKPFINGQNAKKLTIQKKINQKNSIQQQPLTDITQRVSLNRKQTKEPKDRKGILSQRKPTKQNQVSLTNFRIKPTANAQTDRKQSKINKTEHKNTILTNRNNSEQINYQLRQSEEIPRNSIQAEFKDQIVGKQNYEVKDLFKDPIVQTQKRIFSSKIFVKKQKNNIEDIFEAFNPKSTKNLMINLNAPTSKTHSRNSSMKFDYQSGNVIDQEEQKKPVPKEFEVKFDYAARLESQGKYLQAFQVYTQLYKHYKQAYLKQLTLLGLAYNFQLQKLFEQAQKTYLKCSRYNNSQAFMKLGQLLIRRNRIDSGIQNLQKANCIKRFDRQIQTKLVYGYSLKEQTIQKALSLANSILKRYPMSLQILIMTANILQKQSKIKQALDICLAIDNHKQSQFIKHYIGTLYLCDGNVVQAFKFFKQALQIKSNHVPSLIEIGTILSQLKPKQAISILNKALQIQPENRLALARLAKIYESIEENPEKAMEIYRKTLQTKLNYQAYIKIGNCLQSGGSYLEALVHYKQALNLKKTHEVYTKIAEMHEFKKQYKKSIQNYQLALQIVPKQHKYYQEKNKIMFKMAKAMLILQQFDSAISTLQALLETQESKQIYSMLGQGYFGKQQYSIALQFYQKANNIEPDKEDVQILERLALCFDKKEQFNASKQIYEKILEIDPHNIKCMNNLANILLILGNTNQAFYWYEFILQNCPKNIEKRIKVADIYSAVGDWSKVQYHLLICYKQKQHDSKVLQKLINLYKQKRESKLVAKYQKKLALLKVNNKKKDH